MAGAILAYKIRHLIEIACFLLSRRILQNLLPEAIFRSLFGTSRPYGRPPYQLPRLILINCPRSEFMA